MKKEVKVQQELLGLLDRPMLCWVGLCCVMLCYVVLCPTTEQMEVGSHTWKQVTTLHCNNVI